MPRFELNPRTGMMEPKKDDQIYFAQSQGGGLRIDDHKNNVKYVIERDGRITNIAGIRDNQVNLYDMRDARIIADRVVRMFGRDHKYADFHYFLKGYRMDEDVVKKFDEFVNETSWGGMVRRSSGENVRKEEGERIGMLEDGTILFMGGDDFQSGELVEFDGKNFYYIEDTDDYIAIINTGDEDIYFRYDSEAKGTVNMVECFSAREKLRNNDFGFIRSYMSQAGYVFKDLDDINIEIGKHYMRFSNGAEEYEVWDDEDAVQDYAIEREVELFDECYDFGDSKTMKSTIEAWRNSYGDGFIDVKSIEDSMRESYESWFDDMDEDDLINDLINYSIIDDTEEYFDVNEDGELDHELPKFEVSDYKDDYVDYMMNQIDDVVDEYLLNYGYEGFEEYIDKDKLAKLIVDEIGRGQVLASYDGVEGEETINKTTYYIYRVN